VPRSSSSASRTTTTTTTGAVDSDTDPCLLLDPKDPLRALPPTTDAVVALVEALDQRYA
jgi:hypothetical protein